MDKLTSSISSEILVFCERLEIAEFMNAYFKYLLKSGIIFPAIQIINCRSLNKIPSILEKITTLDNQQCVKKVLILADAIPHELQKRKDFLNALGSSKYLRKMGYCKYFFFPGKVSPKRWQQGYLEDMLVKSLVHDNQENQDYYNLLYIIEDYLLSIKNSQMKDKLFTNYSKHLLYTYFSATEKYVGLHLGEAANKGAFSLNHQVFDDLKEYVMELKK